MFRQINGKEWAEKVPATLPVYNIAGDQDPVGMYGQGVYQVSNWLAETGHDVLSLRHIFKYSRCVFRWRDKKTR